MRKLFIVLLLIPTLAHAALKGIGGLEAEPPAWTEFSNVLTNPGFESGTTGWTLGTSGCVQSSEQSHSGTYSLKCPATVNASYPYQTKQVNAPRFAVRAWVKSGNTLDNLNATNPYPVVRAYLFDADRGSVAMGAADATTCKVPEWTQVTLKANTGYLAPGATNDNLTLRLTASGALNNYVYFDDVELVPLQPILRNFIKYPNYRGLLWSDKSQIITGVVETVAPEGHALSEYYATVDIKNDAGVTQDTITLNTLTSTNEWSYSAASWPSDAELLISTTLKLKTDNSTVATFSDWRVVKKLASTRANYVNWFDTDNFLVRNGVKTFPWGVYDRVGGNRVPDGYYTLSPNISNYRGLLGFNNQTLMNSYADTHCNMTLYFSPMSGGNPGVPTSASDTINPWADALAEVGAAHMHIMQDYHTGATYRPSWASGMTDTVLWQTTAQKLNHNTAFYYASDEPDYQHAPLLYQIWNQYNVLRAETPDRPTFVALYGPESSNMYRYYADVLASDIYPFLGLTMTDYLTGDNAAGAPYDRRPSQWTGMINSFNYGSRPLMANLQLFQANGNSVVQGDDHLTYTSKIAHTATADNRPLTGANWQTYWGQFGPDPATWVNDTSYSFQTVWGDGDNNVYTAKLLHTSSADNRPPTGANWQTYWNQSRVWTSGANYTQESFPTYDLMRRMAWGSIINGATGIMWWGFVSSSGMEDQWYVDHNYRTWTDFKRISDEVMGLEAMLISSPLSLVSTTNSNIQLLTKQHPSTGKIYAMALNTSTSSQSATFTTTFSPTAVAAYSESRSMTPSGNTFSDTFLAHDVHVYELTASSSTPRIMRATGKYTIK